MSDIEQKLIKLTSKLYAYYMLYKLGKVKIAIQDAKSSTDIIFMLNGNVLAVVKVYEPELRKILST